MLGVHPSGFYAWLKEPLSLRALEDERQTKLVKDAWNDSGKIYGYRKIYDDLVEMSEAVSESRVARLARLAGIQAQIGYKKKPGVYGGKPSVVVDNTLDRQFTVEAPDRAWVTDITYLRTHEGFAYLCVVLDLHSRRVTDWAVSSRMKRDLAIRALKMAIALRQPPKDCIHHTDRGSQYCSHDYQKLLRQRGFQVSMSRKGNCYDNSAVETFFKTIKAELIWRRS